MKAFCSQNLALFLIVVTGCGQHVPERPDTGNNHLENLENAFNFASVGQSKAAVNALAKSNNQFAFELYSQLHTQQGNLFLSPFSISTALAQAYAGARGDTESQMAEVLHFDLDQVRLHPAVSALLKRVQSRTRKGVEINVANRLWGQEDYKFTDNYLKLSRQQYRAELGLVDFVEHTEDARLTINTWVKEQTNEKIKELLAKGMVDESTRLVLTNAIYFKGDWASQFDKTATKNAPFYLTAEDNVEVPMMYQHKEFYFGYNEDVQILELPYIGNDLSMLVLLPLHREGLPTLEEKLTRENVEKWSAALHKRKIAVYLPKFTMTSEFNLNEVLQDMGMTSAFDVNFSDFSGMTSHQELYIGAVVHKAFVDVNEEGTEAAAATALTMRMMSAVPPTFRADHPFIFIIRDNQTGSILFLGRGTNPTK